MGCVWSLNAHQGLGLVQREIKSLSVLQRLTLHRRPTCPRQNNNGSQTYQAGLSRGQVLRAAHMLAALSRSSQRCTTLRPPARRCCCRRWRSWSRILRTGRSAPWEGESLAFLNCQCIGVCSQRARHEGVPVNAAKFRNAVSAQAAAAGCCCFTCLDVFWLPLGIVALGVEVHLAIGVRVEQHLELLRILRHGSSTLKVQGKCASARKGGGCNQRAHSMPALRCQGGKNVVPSRFRSCQPRSAPDHLLCCRDRQS